MRGMLSPVRQALAYSWYITSKSAKRKGQNTARKLGYHTSLIGAVVSGIAVGVVEKQRSEERLHAKHFLSMMSIKEVSYLVSNGTIIRSGQLTGSLRQVVDAKDYTWVYTYYEARPPPHLPIEAYCGG
jgi:hypothetical protein